MGRITSIATERAGAGKREGRGILWGRVALLAVLVVGIPADSRAERWPIRSFGTEDGLPSLEVSGIDRDPMGFLWFGTPGGLVRYDGKRFQTWRTGHELPPSSILDVTWAEGRHWIATSQGLFRSVPGTRSFESVPAVTGERVSLVWSDPRGELWVGAGERLLRIDGDSGEVSSEVALDPSGLSGPVLDAVADRRGDLWFALDGGVLRRSGDLWVSYRLEDWSSSPRVMSLDAGADGCMRLVAGLRLIALRPGDAPEAPTAPGLHRPVPAPGRGLGCPERPETSWWVGPDNGLPPVYWDADVLRDRHGVVWVGTAEGLARGDEDGWQVLSHREGFPSTHIRRFHEDAEGNLWISTEFHGVQVILARGFRTWTGADGLAGGRTGFLVKGLLEGPGGRLHAITDVEGLGRFVDRLDPGGWTTFSPWLPPDFDRISWGQGRFVTVDSRGSWWLPMNKGVSRWDGSVPADALREPASTVYTTADGLPEEQVLTLYEDRRGDLWMGTQGERLLTRWIRARDRFESFGPEDGVPPDSLAAWSFAEDRRGALWVGLYRNGILRWDGHELKHFGRAAGVPPGRVTDLHVDRSGRLWAASRELGLVVCDDPTAEEPGFRPVRRGPGRQGVEAIDEDADGVFWLGTENGVVRWRPGSEFVERFGTADGLATTRVLVLERTSEGTLWVGTSGGVSRWIDGGATVAPRGPLFTEISLDGESVPVPVVGVERRTLGRLGAGDHRLELQVAAPSGALRPLGPLEWRWGEGEWSEIGVEGVLHLAGMGAGRHRLEVRLSPEARGGSDESSSEGMAVLDFEVSPPFWRRPEFLLLALGLVVGGLTLRHRSRIRRLLEIERVRTRVAADLHDDLGATLSRISLQSELARRGAGDREELLNEIGRSAREGLDAMRDLVWALDPRQDDLETLFSRLRDLAGRQLEPLGVSLRVRVDPQIEGVRLEGEARRHLFLILKEAVTNVAKHASAERLTIDAGRASGGLRIVIEDDGRGLDDPPGGREGRGLSNMRNRAESLGGRLVMSRREPGGTRIELVVPFGAATGGGT